MGTKQLLCPRQCSVSRGTLCCANGSQGSNRCQRPLNTRHLAPLCQMGLDLVNNGTRVRRSYVIISPFCPQAVGVSSEYSNCLQCRSSMDTPNSKPASRMNERFSSHPHVLWQKQNGVGVCLCVCGGGAYT